MSHISLNGRFPTNRASFIGTHISQVSCDHECVCIRLEHEVHPDFWLEIRIHETQLCEWHQVITDALLSLAQDDPRYQKFMRQAVKEITAWAENRQEDFDQKPPWEN